MPEGTIRFESTLTVDTGFLASVKKNKNQENLTERGGIGTKLDMQSFLQLDVYTGRNIDIYLFLQ